MYRKAFHKIISGHMGVTRTPEQKFRTDTSGRTWRETYWTTPKHAPAAKGVNRSWRKRQVSYNVSRCKDHLKSGNGSFRAIPISKKRNWMVIVAVDYLTKCVELLTNREGGRCSRILHRWYRQMLRVWADTICSKETRDKSRNNVELSATS